MSTWFTTINTNTTPASWSPRLTTTQRMAWDAIPSLDPATAAHITVSQEDFKTALNSEEHKKWLDAYGYEVDALVQRMKIQEEEDAEMRKRLEEEVPPKVLVDQGVQATETYLYWEVEDYNFPDTYYWRTEEGVNAKVPEAVFNELDRMHGKIDGLEYWLKEERQEIDNLNLILESVHRESLEYQHKAWKRKQLIRRLRTRMALKMHKAKRPKKVVKP